MSAGRWASIASRCASGHISIRGPEPFSLLFGRATTTRKGADGLVEALHVLHSRSFPLAVLRLGRLVQARRAAARPRRKAGLGRCLQR